jgi:hypothetical protein
VKTVKKFVNSFWLVQSRFAAKVLDKAIRGCSANGSFCQCKRSLLLLSNFIFYNTNNSIATLNSADYKSYENQTPRLFVI